MIANLSDLFFLQTHQCHLGEITATCLFHYMHHSIIITANGIINMCPIMRDFSLYDC